MRILVLGAAVVAANGCVLPSFAQERAVLEEIVVTASRSSRAVSDTPASVVVIEREEIERALAARSTPAELIARLVPGYSFSNQTISGASENFRGRDVMVMVNGVPRTTPLRNISRVLNLVDLSTVERIEIVSGASSLYGSGATGGTINFITRRGEGDKPTVTVRAGARAFTANLAESVGPDGSVSVSGTSGAVDYFVSGSGYWTRRTYGGSGAEMPSDAMLGQGGGDRTQYGDLSAMLGYELGSRRFELSAEWTYAEQKPDWFTNYATDPASPAYGDAYTGDPLTEDSKYFTGRFTESDFILGSLEIKAFYNDIEKGSPFSTLSAANSQVYYSGNPSDPTAWFNQSTLYSERTGVNATVDSPLDWVKEGAKLTWGVDYAHDTTSQELANGWDAIAPMTQDSVAAFAQLDVPVTERLRLRGGVRYEKFFLDVEDFTRPDAWVLGFSPTFVPTAIEVYGGSFDYDALTFNAGAVFDVTDEVEAFASFSQGFSITDIGAFTRRAGINSAAEICDAYGNNPVIPTLLGLYYGYSCAANPGGSIDYADIAPEPQIVNSYEIGTRGNWQIVRASLSGFLSTSDDGVTYDVAANRVTQQAERIWGAEFSGEIDVTTATTIGLVLAYQEGLYDADKDGEIESDEWMPNNRIATPFKAVASLGHHFDSGLYLRGEAEILSGRDKIAGETLDGTALFNLIGSYGIGSGTLGFGIRNIFDTDYINPTATATRSVPVEGLGRTLAISYTTSF
ncbi:TonB-dependent receptor [Prosthecomicrobium pneumaticum]|uniref:Iron complex outermembrane receptor protein n=1 Tax=Prosthecomicrobium pneumaticum TaxID=81895 RepID=A0A7W9CUF6_9HYPH|nr:TonB-dependent receptor [Prosthecomicrobium pneumaticum]MBB5751758.1 iron complex outermembrane receptor protein [Prosthecomicrobium pneumaticum]